MNEVEAAQVTRQWLAGRRGNLTANAIRAELAVPEPGQELNKAVVTFESAKHIGSLTAWGRGGAVEEGTVELLALDLATQREVIVDHASYESAE